MSQVQTSKENTYNNPATYTTNYAMQGTNPTTNNPGPSQSYYYQQPAASYEYASNAPAGYTTQDSSKYATNPPGYATGYAPTGATVYTTGGSSSYTGTSGVSGQRAGVVDIPVESRIEYIPFEKKYVEYQQVQRIYQVPVETEVIEYQEIMSSERIPIERTVTDYYAVQTQVQYIRREIEETVMVQEPVERVYERVQYIPVETQIVHYPERDNYVPAPTRTRTEYVGIQGQEVVTGASAVGGYPAYYAGQQGSRVATGVTFTSAGQPTATYQTGYTNQQGNTTNTYKTSFNQPGAPTGSYQASYGQPTTTTTTYQTGRQGGYVTGGSGVRGGTYVTGSNVKQSYEGQTYY